MKLKLNHSNIQVSNCGTPKLQEWNFSPKKMQVSPSPDFRNWTSPQKMQLWQVQTSGIKLFPPKNAIINYGTSKHQKSNFSPKKIQLWQVQTSGIKLFPQKNAIINCGTSILQKLNFSPQKMQLWQVQTSGIELFPQKMQLLIVARPYFRNWTFPPKKCNCGKSKLQELNFSPKKCNYQLWHVHTSQIELFPPKNAIVASPDFRNWTFPRKMQLWQVLAWQFLKS